MQMQINSAMDKNDKDNIPEIQIVEQPYPAQLITQTENPSQFTKAYCQQIDLESLPKDLPQFNFQEQPSIKYRKLQQYHQFDFSVNEITPNFSIVQLKIVIGKFQLNFFLLNEQGSNPFQKVQSSKEGSYGKIYFTHYRNQKIALKCFPFNQNNRAFIISQAIKQYSILKICSALKISVQTGNYYGFHFILYEDSIMFVMEKGQPMPKISNGTPLKKLLAKMHSYNIIHYDIKPQNICFSKKHNKIVFIDFGLSEIVKQNLGQKTFTNFRGSTRFCGQQILKLFGSLQKYDNVDLYYNDLLCLLKSYNLMVSKKQDLSIEESIDYDQSQFIITQEQQYVEQILILYHFKYSLINELVQEIKNLSKTNNGCLFQNYIKEVICFAKSLILFNFVGKNIHQYLQPIRQKPQYQEIKNALKMKAQHYQFKQKTQRERQKIDSQIYQKRLVIPKYSHSISLQLETNKNYYRKCVEFLGIQNNFLRFERIEQYLSILVQCLRFDSSNLAQKEKIEVAIKFIKMASIPEQKQYSPIQPIKTVFSYLLQLCISLPFQGWKKPIIVTVLLQHIILGINIIDLMDQINNALDLLFIEWTDKLTMALQMYNIYYVGILKHVDSTSSPNAQIINRCYKFFQHYISVCILQGKCSDNQQQRIISEMLLRLQKTQITTQKGTVIDLSYYSCQLKKISNLFLKRKVKQFVYYQILGQFFNEGHQKYFQELFGIIRNEIYQQYFLRSSYLHYNIAYLYSFMLTMRNYRELLILSKNVQKIINCEQIFRNFKFKMTIFLLSKGKDDQLLHQCLIKIIKFDNEFAIQNKESRSFIKSLMNSSILIQRTLYKISNNFNLCKKHALLIEQFFVKFKFWQKSITYSKYFYLDMEIVMFFSTIYKILCKISPNIKSQFKQYLYQLKILINNKFKNDNLMLLRGLQYWVHAANFYQLENDTVRCSESFQKLFEIASMVKNIKFKNYCFKNIIIINANPKNNPKRLLFWLQLFYQFNLELDSMIWYFNAFKFHYIDLTLKCFQQAGLVEKLYNFLRKLSDFLTAYPLLIYSKEWFQNINSFSKVYPFIFKQQRLDHFIGKIIEKNRYGIFYYIFSLDIQTDNKNKLNVLKKISLHLIYLNTFIKDEMLRKYYGHLQKLEEEFCPRKNVLLFMKQQYKYLDTNTNKTKFKKILLKRLKLLKKTRQNKKINLIFSKIYAKINISKDKKCIKKN